MTDTELLIIMVLLSVAIVIVGATLLAMVIGA